MLHCNGPWMSKRQRIIQLTEKSTGCCFETLDVISEHLGPPISKTRRDGLLLTCNYLTRTTFPVGGMIVEHSFLILKAQKSAERRAFLLRMGNKRFITHLVIQPGSEQFSGFPASPDIQFPPE